jgi:hypothetical protein
VHGKRADSGDDHNRLSVVRGVDLHIEAARNGNCNRSNWGSAQPSLHQGSGIVAHYHGAKETKSIKMTWQKEDWLEIGCHLENSNLGNCILDPRAADPLGNEQMPAWQ